MVERLLTTIDKFYIKEMFVYTANLLILKGIFTLHFFGDLVKAKKHIERGISIISQGEDSMDTSILLLKIKANLALAEICDSEGEKPFALKLIWENMNTLQICQQSILNEFFGCKRTDNPKFIKVVKYQCLNLIFMASLYSDMNVLKEAFESIAVVEWYVNAFLERDDSFLKSVAFTCFQFNERYKDIYHEYLEFEHYMKYILETKNFDIEGEKIFSKSKTKANLHSNRGHIPRIQIKNKKKIGDKSKLKTKESMLNQNGDETPRKDFFISDAYCPTPLTGLSKLKQLSTMVTTITKLKNSALNTLMSNPEDSMLSLSNNLALQLGRKPKNKTCTSLMGIIESKNFDREYFKTARIREIREEKEETFKHFGSSFMRSRSLQNAINTSKKKSLIITDDKKTTFYGNTEAFFADLIDDKLNNAKSKTKINSYAR